MLFAAGQDVLGPERVDFVEVLPRAPDSRDGSHMKHGVDSLAGSRYRFRIAQITLNGFDAQVRQVGVFPARETPYLVASVDEQLGNVPSKKATGSGDER